MFQRGIPKGKQAEGETRYLIGDFGGETGTWDVTVGTLGTPSKPILFVLYGMVISYLLRGAPRTHEGA